MKNPIQLVSLIYVENQEIRNLIESQYEDVGGRYHRYYPNDSDYDANEGDTDKINSWLESEGYTIKNENNYLYLMIDFS
jgi:hypothetical protein